MAAPGRPNACLTPSRSRIATAASAAVIRDMWVLLLSRSGPGRPLLQGQPAEAVGAGAARLVLEPDVAGVPGCRQGAERAVEVQRAGSRLVTAWRIGDLHVPDPVGVQLDGLDQVVAVDRQVVQVAEEPEVGRARLPLDAVDDPDGVGGGLEGIAGRAADRLDEDHAAHPLRGRGGKGQMLDRQVVLLLRRGVVDPVPVQGVEAPAAQLLADADGHRDVVAELGPPGRPGHQPAIAARHVPGEEVQAHQPDVGLPDRADEGVHVTVARHRDVKGPPELDRVEPHGPRRPGTLVQRELGEQDGQVDVELGHADPSSVSVWRINYPRYGQVSRDRPATDPGGPVWYHPGAHWGCSSVRQSASLARRKSGVQIPSPPPPTSQVRASAASSGWRSLHVAAALRPRIRVAVPPRRLSDTGRPHGHRTPGQADARTGRWTLDTPRGHRTPGHQTFTPDAGHRTPDGRSLAEDADMVTTHGRHPASWATTPSRGPLGR